MTNRRKFIKLAAAGTVVVGVGYGATRALRPFERSIADILKKDLKGLKIKPTDIEKFAVQAATENPWGLGSMQQRLIGLYGTPGFRWLPLPYKDKYVEYRDQIVARFLLSTDFFLNKMDESKEVNYLGRIWGPYAMPCMNPFSAMFYKL
jgi:hypothetical protein